MRLFTLAVLAILLSSLLGAQAFLMPSKTLIADAGVRDIIYKNHRLYAATVAGSVDIFDTKSFTKTETIKLPQITNFLGEKIAPQILSVDVIENTILLLAQAELGYRRVYIYSLSTKKLQCIIDTDKKLSIAKAKFLDSQTLLLGLLGNDILSYSISSGHINWKRQASQSKFSNFVLSEDRSQVIIADESGELHSINTANGEIIRTYTGENLDNVFQLDEKNGIIIAGGQDRRVAIYRGSKQHHIQSKFIVYSVGLSPSASLGAFSADEHNNVVLFNTLNDAKIVELGGNKMTISNILFINENELFISSDSSSINYYKLK